MDDGDTDEGRQRTDADERYLSENRALVDGWLAAFSERQRRAILDRPLGIVTTPADRSHGKG